MFMKGGGAVRGLALPRGNILASHPGFDSQPSKKIHRKKLLMLLRLINGVG